MTNISNYASFWNWNFARNELPRTKSVLALSFKLHLDYLIPSFLHKNCRTKISKITERNDKSTKTIFIWIKKILPMVPFYVKQKLN